MSRKLSFSVFRVRCGERARRSDQAGSADDETTDAVRDHNDIRDGIRDASQYEVGTGEWWQAVSRTRAANSDHMAEEEREALADFRRHTAPQARHTAPQARHDLAVEFAVYEAAHAGGVPLADKGPGRYVREHSG